MMRNGRITGLGGVFFKTSDPIQTMEWYKRNLGLEVDGQYGATLEWRSSQSPEKKGYTAWSPFKENSTYFEPSSLPFMVNFRVENLEALLAELKENGISQIGEMETFEYGKFAWILDPNGLKIELWEPNDDAYEQMVGENIHKT